MLSRTKEDPWRLCGSAGARASVSPRRGVSGREGASTRPAGAPPQRWHTRGSVPTQTCWVHARTRARPAGGVNSPPPAGSALFTGLTSGAADRRRRRAVVVGVPHPTGGGAHRCCCLRPRPPPPTRGRRGAGLHRAHPSGCEPAGAAASWKWSGRRPLRGRRERERRGSHVQVGTPAPVLGASWPSAGASRHHGESVGQLFWTSTQSCGGGTCPITHGAPTRRRVGVWPISVRVPPPLPGLMSARVPRGSNPPPPHGSARCRGIVVGRRGGTPCATASFPVPPFPPACIVVRYTPHPTGRLGGEWRRQLKRSVLRCLQSGERSCRIGVGVSSARRDGSRPLEIGISLSCVRWGCGSSLAESASVPGTLHLSQRRGLARSEDADPVSVRAPPSLSTDRVPARSALIPPPLPSTHLRPSWSGSEP